MKCENLTNIHNYTALPISDLIDNMSRQRSKEKQKENKENILEREHVNDSGQTMNK